MAWIRASGFHAAGTSKAAIDAVVEGADIGDGAEPFAGPGRRRAFDPEVSAGLRRAVWDSGGVQELPDFPGGDSEERCDVGRGEEGGREAAGVVRAGEGGNSAAAPAASSSSSSYAAASAAAATAAAPKIRLCVELGVMDGAVCVDTRRLCWRGAGAVVVDAEHPCEKCACRRG